MDFIYYRDLQAFLDEQFLCFGKTLSFAQALRAMWEQGLVRAGEIVPVDFSRCDIADPRAINRFIDQIQIPYSRDSVELESSASLPVDLIVFKHPSHSRAGVHYQDGLELNYVYSGACTLFFEGREYVIRENEVVIIPPHAMHDIYDTEGSIVFSFLIHQDTFNDTFFQVLRTNTPLAAFYNQCIYQKSDSFPRFRVDEPAQFVHIFLSMYSEFASDKEYRYEICVNYIRILFACLLRQPEVSFEPHSPGIAGSTLNDMPAILQYIKNNYRTVSLDALSEAFHYDRSYLGKQIKAHTRQTFSDLVAGYRLDSARTLLLYSDRSMEDIAGRSGYQSADHFSRMFKKKHGLSPSQYRKRHACRD